MNVVVYCGSKVGNKDIFQKVATDLGNWIGNNKHDLVYGGGNVGLMGIVADKVLELKQNVIGVMPKFLVDREVAHKNLTRFITVETMSERKKIMSELGELFIALPGGLGTLEEIMEVISWGALKLIKGPFVFINTEGYYEGIKIQLSNVLNHGFLTNDIYNRIHFIENINELDYIVKNSK
ncbi:MAG: TIGR00730 family Rossman fold protein [Acholeplasma sp.]|nr:TIGR00730 family Rossman fold protein [Acholeplasma sp.]